MQLDQIDLLLIDSPNFDRVVEIHVLNSATLLEQQRVDYMFLY